jgi:hypothetical protein
MSEKKTTKEIVVRMLLQKGVGEWTYGYELQGKHTEWGFSGVDADTRAHELARQGYFDSSINRYFIEHRRVKKYAEFRISRVERIVTSVEWFDSLPVKSAA